MNKKTFLQQVARPQITFNHKCYRQRLSNLPIYILLRNQEIATAQGDVIARSIRKF